MKNKTVLNFFQNLSLDKKFAAAITACVILSIALLTILIVRRETLLLESDNRKNAEVLAASINIALKDNMLGGRPKETVRLIKELSGIKGVEEIAILNPDGRPAFGMPALALELKEDIKENILKGHEAEFSIAESQYFIKPLINEQQCRSCHTDNKQIRGAVSVRLSTSGISGNIIDLVERMTGFGISASIIISTLLIILARRMLISPIKGLTEAATQLAATTDRTGEDYLDVKVDVKGHDELAILGERFNRMIERIKQANEELKRTHEKLVQSEKLASIGILAAGVAHEINNPLGGLFNCLHLLRQNIDNHEFRERYLDFIKEGLEKIENIVNRLLYMARKDEHKTAVINVRDSVENVYSFVDYKAKEGRVSFVNEIENSLSIIIDPHDFQQVVLNLFINAIQSMEDGGSLKVRGYREDSKIKVEFSDTGSGIAHENLGRIFDPFFTTKPSGEGQGLGLWLTYEIIRSYNGKISVESEAGKGSTFTLTFPTGDPV